MAKLAKQDLDHVLEHADQCWPAFGSSRIFITGGTGFVGKWLLESLLHANDRLKLGVKVTALTRNPGRFRTEYPHLALHPAVQLLAGDVTSFEFPSGEFPFLIHAATERSFPPTPDEPTSTFNADVAGTRRVLEFARERGTKRFLFTSSGAVYGRQPSDLTHIPEEYPGAPSPCEPGSAYGQAKRVSEFLCTMSGRQYGFDALIARLFAFAGPYLPMRGNFAVGNFILDALNGGPIKVKGDGTPYRSYLYAADLAVWLWTILVCGEAGRPYNVGSGDAVTIAELASAVAKIVRPHLNVVTAHQAGASIPVERYVPSVDRSAKELALIPRIGLLDGLQRMFSFAKANASAETNNTPKWDTPVLSSPTSRAKSIS